MLFVTGGRTGASESSGYCNSSFSPYPMSCFKLPAATCKEINDDLRSIGKLGEAVPSQRSRIMKICTFKPKCFLEK
ncbi:unnamed protein product [Prunus armeniaca]